MPVAKATAVPVKKKTAKPKPPHIPQLLPEYSGRVHVQERAVSPLDREVVVVCQVRHRPYVRQGQTRFGTSPTGLKARAYNSYVIGVRDAITILMQQRGIAPFAARERLAVSVEFRVVYEADIDNLLKGLFDTVQKAVFPDDRYIDESAERRVKVKTEDECGLVLTVRRAVPVTGDLRPLVDYLPTPVME